MTDEENNAGTKHPLTTRRGFIGGLGFGSLSLAAVWAGYGALSSGGHAHGGQMMSVAQFKALTDDFISANRQSDGSVTPVIIDPERARSMGHHSLSDVYISAFKWGFAPNLIRLKADHLYRFRMMSLDVTHGASINLGSGSLMIRLPAGVMVDQDLAFSTPGEYLIYCSSYCGIAHDHMQAKLIVEPS